jgi:hypothetical protein
LASPQARAPEQAEVAELKKKVAALERSLGRKTYELEVAGELSREADVSTRVSRARAVAPLGAHLPSSPASLGSPARCCTGRSAAGR